MSVSNLVRNVLGHAFGLVGDVVADSHAIARAARGDARSRRGCQRRRAIDEVIGWQPIVLAKNAVCARCNEILAEGQAGRDRDDRARCGRRDRVYPRALEETE